MSDFIMLPNNVKTGMVHEAARRRGYSDTPTREKLLKELTQLINKYGADEILIRGLVASHQEVAAS